MCSSLRVFIRLTQAFHMAGYCGRCGEEVAEGDGVNRLINIVDHSVPPSRFANPRKTRVESVFLCERCNRHIDFMNQLFWLVLVAMIVGLLMFIASMK